MHKPQRPRKPSDFEKVPILLAEYNTLRAEILSRYSGLLQSSAIASTAILALLALALRESDRNLWILLGAVVLTYAGIWVWIDYDTHRAAARIRFLETEINRRAGERLLAWETKFGGGGLLFGRRKRRAVIDRRFRTED